jgi:ADP-ribose pyrophosphatase YjhB (NUDIX family)
MRTDHEALLVVHRPGPEFLVLLRTGDDGYWHLVAGGVEEGETPAEAAGRELAEETGLASVLRAIPLELGYRRPDETWITLHAFAAAAPSGWEPALNEEHDEYRWCAEGAALALLEYPEPREALAHVARDLEALA